MGLGLIGWGGAMGGAGGGLVAMALILRPFRQCDQPSGDLDHQHHEPDPEHQEQQSELPGVCVVRRRSGCSARSRSTSGNSIASGSMYSAMISAALALKDQSLLGHRTVSTQPPTTMKATTATHTQAESSVVIARDPKKDVVIAAAAINTPARDRSSFTARSCASSARPASSNASS